MLLRYLGINNFTRKTTYSFLRTILSYQGKTYYSADEYHAELLERYLHGLTDGNTEGIKVLLLFLNNKNNIQKLISSSSINESEKQRLFNDIKNELTKTIF